MWQYYNSLVLELRYMTNHIAFWWVLQIFLFCLLSDFKAFLLYVMWALVPNWVSWVFYCTSFWYELDYIVYCCPPCFVLFAVFFAHCINISGVCTVFLCICCELPQALWL